MGSPTIIADVELTEHESEIAARLVDVSPAGHRALVARGLLPPGSAAAARSSSCIRRPTGFAAGHVPKLELLPSDAPYARNSNGQTTITVSNLELRLPVHDQPGSLGGVVEAPRPPRSSRPVTNWRPTTAPAQAPERARVPAPARPAGAPGSSATARSASPAAASSPPARSCSCGCAAMARRPAAAESRSASRPTAPPSAAPSAARPTPSRTARSEAPPPRPHPIRPSLRRRPPAPPPPASPSPSASPSRTPPARRLPSSCPERCTCGPDADGRNGRPVRSSE